MCLKNLQCYMRLPFNISLRAWIILIAILVLFCGWLILHFLILNFDPVRPFVIKCFEPYLLLTEKLSNYILYFTTPGVFIENQRIINENTVLDSFDSGVLFKKLTSFVLILIWITRAPVRKKILFTGILIITNFIFVAIDNAILAHIVFNEFNEESLPKISRTPGLVAFTTIFTIWILTNRISILDSLSKFRLNTKLIDSKIPEIIIILYAYIIFNNFIYGYLDLHIWRNIMIATVQKILALLGYDSVIEGHYIVGDYGVVFVDRGCVGFNSILKFASVVFLTGISNRKRWNYILSGSVFLEIISCIRLIMIFIWYKEYGFEKAMAFHDLSKNSIHVIIFILWIIWFEFFTDIRPKQGKRKGEIYSIFV